MVMIVGVIVSQQGLGLLQLVVSAVKPALLKTQHQLLQGQDHEEAEAEHQIGDGVVNLNIVLFFYLFEDFFHLLIGLGKKIQETGGNKDSSTEARAVAQNSPPQGSGCGILIVFDPIKKLKWEEDGEEC